MKDPETFFRFDHSRGTVFSVHKFSPSNPARTKAPEMWNADIAAS